MNKHLKRVIGIGSIIIIAVCFYLIYRINTKIYYNEDSYIGNTAGNLYNGGIFCKQDETIYFSNFNDDGALYSMDLDFSHVKKINTDKACYINVDDHYIYYSKQNWTKENPVQSIFIYYTSGLYRINKNGKRTFSLYHDPVGVSLLAGNYVYYQHYNKETGLHFYKSKIDGTEKTKLSEYSIMPASVHNGALYYTTGSSAPNHNIYTLDLKTDTVQTFYEGNCYMPIATDQFVYYISLDDNYKIKRISYDKTINETLVNEFCSTFNISEDGTTLYYQIDGGNDNRIASMDLTTGTQTTIMDGDYKSIHVIDSYVFFRDFNETTTYLLDTAANTLSTFNAPVVD